MRKFSDKHGWRVYVGTDGDDVFIQCEAPGGLHCIELNPPQAVAIADALRDAAKFIRDMSEGEADDA